MVEFNFYLDEETVKILQRLKRTDLLGKDKTDNEYAATLLKSLVLSKAGLSKQKMEFIFDEDKLKIEGYTETECLDVVRALFKKYDKDNSIIETHPGFFEGTDKQDDFNAFGASARLIDTSWFLKVIREWYWYSDEGQGEEKEDCLKSYYKVEKRNH